MTDLIHFSKDPVLVPYSVEQADAPNMKPRGLWVSLEGNGDGWRDWCRAEGFYLNRLKYAHKIVLAETAEILRIGTADGIDRLTNKHGDSGRCWDIRWHEIATKYQGIIIAPYIWERRLDGDARWYYSWDCASGCIWDATAIARVSIVDLPVGAEAALDKECEGE